MTRFLMKGQWLTHDNCPPNQALVVRQMRHEQLTKVYRSKIISTGLFPVCGTVTLQDLTLVQSVTFITCNFICRLVILSLESWLGRQCYETATKTRAYICVCDNVTELKSKGTKSSHYFSRWNMVSPNRFRNFSASACGNLTCRREKRTQVTRHASRV